MCGLSRWNSIFRMTLVTLGSPGLRAGKSPDFLVLRGLARSGRSRVKVPGARILSKNVAKARSACSGGKGRDGVRRGGQGPGEADLVRGGCPRRPAVAQKIPTLFIDDLDGSSAEGTVRFGLDGTEYEIDLNAAHAKELRDALARYVDAARRTSGGARKSARGSRRGPASGLNTTEVREWARAQGIEVKDRGRVPADLMVKFKSATGRQG